MSIGTSGRGNRGGKQDEAEDKVPDREHEDDGEDEYKQQDHHEKEEHLVEGDKANKEDKWDKQLEEEGT